MVILVPPEAPIITRTCKCFLCSLFDSKKALIIGNSLMNNMWYASHLSLLVCDESRTHGGGRSLPRFYEVGFRWWKSPLISVIWSGEVRHLVVEDDPSPGTTPFRPKPEKFSFKNLHSLQYSSILLSTWNAWHHGIGPLSPSKDPQDWSA